MEPDAVEIRVVGCLIEKQRTTPDAYPLSLNSLRLACNQATNRDPVVDYDEATVAEALRRLALRGWTRLASGAGSRARKYRHLLPEALGVDDGRAGAAGGADAARRADAGRAEAAQRAPARVRRPRRRAGGARWPGRARLRRPPRAPPGPEGAPLRAAPRRLGEEASPTGTSGAGEAGIEPTAATAAADGRAGTETPAEPEPGPGRGPPHPAGARSWPSCAPSSAACARRWARAD